MSRLLFFLFALSFSLPNILLAGDFTYGSIQNWDDKHLLLKMSGLEDSSHYLCEFDNFACDKVSSGQLKNIAAAFVPAIDRNGMLGELGAIYDRSASFKTFSSTGRFLAYYLSAKVGGDGVRKHVLFDLTGEPKKIDLAGKNAYWDLLSEDLRLFDFSPDESKLVYLDDRNGWPTLYLVDLSNGLPANLAGRQLITKKYTVSDFLFWDNNSIIFSANRENPHLWSLYRLQISSGKLEKVADNVSYAQKMRRAGDFLIFTKIDENLATPVLYQPDDKQTLSFVGLPKPTKRKTESESVSLGGGLHGVMVRPASFDPNKRYPLIIWLHGGPYRQASLAYHSYSSYGLYDWLLDEVAAAGSLVLKLDYHGSYGYGREFAEAIKNNFGKIDVKDVLDARTAIKNEHRIGRVYLAGNSYGGYLALRSIVEKPLGLSGALSINGVTDWQMLLEKLQSSIFNVQFDGLLDENNGQLFYQSAIDERIDNLRGEKIILAQASADRTIPANQADYLYKLLKQKGKSAELIKYPGEDHVFNKKNSAESLCLNLLKLVNLPKQSFCRFD